VVIVGGLWPYGIEHTSSQVALRSRTLSYNVATKEWVNLPLPPFEPGRTQDACVGRSLIVIIGSDGGKVGPRVMRLSKLAAGGDWSWDTSLPALPTAATRLLGVVTSLANKWLVIRQVVETAGIRSKESS
jgi:hypothetical protein